MLVELLHLGLAEPVNIGELTNPHMILVLESKVLKCHEFANVQVVGEELQLASSKELQRHRVIDNGCSIRESANKHRCNRIILKRFFDRREKMLKVMLNIKQFPTVTRCFLPKWRTNSLTILNL